MRFTQLRQRHFPLEWRPQVPCWLQRDYTHIDVDDVPLIERIRLKGRIDCEGIGDWRVTPPMWGESPQEAYARDQAAKSSAVQWQRMDRQAIKEAQARESRRLAQEMAEKEKTRDYQRQLDRRAEIEAQKKRDAIEWERRERDRLARIVAKQEKDLEEQEKLFEEIERQRHEQLMRCRQVSDYQICASCKKNLTRDCFERTVFGLLPSNRICRQCVTKRDQ